MVNKKKITQKTKYNYAKKLPIIIFSICLIMSIGYATINSINLDISGTSVAYNATGIVIEEVKYLSSNNADSTNSKVNKTTGTVLNSTVVLSPTDASSSITYQITMYNLNEYNYRFKETTYETTFYDNTNITYELNGITTDTIIISNERITFDITFKYKDNVTPSSITNTLNSYIQFIFGFTDTVVGDYSYTGDYQTFIAPKTGTYKIELWGAKGSDYYGTETGGSGAYTSGEIYLTSGEILYVYVGEKGKSTNDVTTFNNGTGSSGGWNGGGATDVRLVSGTWLNSSSINSRIMVTAGGGTGSSEGIAGDAGGLIGYPGKARTGGTQTTFAVPEYDFYTIPAFGIANGGCTGGNGYYPGTASACASGSPGGSSFISGHNGCVAIESATSLTPRVDSTGTQCTDGTTDITCSYHYSNYVFENTKMIDGAGYKWTTTKEATQTGMPQISGSGVMNGNSGNGHAKITLLDFVECPDNGQICDLSGNNNHLNIVGATWDKNTGEISTDGIDDYLYIDMLEWNDTSEFTIEFYAQLIGSKGLFFESSKNSNNNYGSFYINTGEYGTNDLTLAMKFNTSSGGKVHHHYINNFIDPNDYHHYVITLNTNNGENKYINMYKDGIKYQTTKIAGQNNITGLTLKNYPFYISSRAGTGSINKLKLKKLRIYTKELTLEEIVNNYNGIKIKRSDLLVSYNFKES